MAENTLPTIGFIGLGSMGSGMTRNLRAAGYSLVVNDVRQEAAEEIIGLGATWADNPAAVAALSDIVITMLPTPRHVLEVATGTAGLLAGLADGGTWIDMSTSVPDVITQIRAMYADRDITYLDAPVSGMSVGAANGMLQIFVGAEEEAFQKCLPVFEAMGDPERILHVGGNGAGYAVKLMINQLWFNHLVATTEVLAVGVKAGVDLGVLRDAIIASPARSNFVENDIMCILQDGDYDEGFAIALACKDLGLSVDLARSVGVPYDLSAGVEQIYRRARAQYGDKAGEMAATKLYEDLMGQDLRLPVATSTAGN